MSVSAGRPINMWFLYVLAVILPFCNAAQQQPLRTSTAPKRVAVIGKAFRCPWAHMDLELSIP